MEIKFSENKLQCMCPTLGQVHTGEQTQEIRLPDTFPDIGRVIECRGQILIRGKEWRGESIGANGGVMVWVLYAPEDGTSPQVVDVWVPFQCRWELPEDLQDGVIHLCPTLTELDARGISARKLMVRTVVDTYAVGLTQQNADIPTPFQVPEDVQMLRQNYPAELPMEAGEKQVQLEEKLSLPAHLPAIQKIVYFSLRPDIEEQKVLGNRLVFRGKTVVELAYLTEEGNVHQWAGEFPYSQYTQLDRDYSVNASGWVLPVVTAAELEVTDGQLSLRGALAAQYTIFDRVCMDVITDAYSPMRDVKIKTEPLKLPMLLDRLTLQAPIEGRIPSQGEKGISAAIYPKYPSLCTDDAPFLRLNGQFNLLAQGNDELLCDRGGNFDTRLPLVTIPENQHYFWLANENNTKLSENGDALLIHSDYSVTAQIFSASSIPVVTQLELGDLKQPDPERPSVIMRRTGEGGVWGLAKHYGSTVEAIYQANHLETEPETGKLLLIPIC